MATISDDFNRPDGVPGATWVLVSGLWVLVSGQLSAGSSGATVVIRAAAGMDTSNHFAQITIAATTPVSQGVWCRGDSTLANGYLMRSDGTTWALFRVNAGTFTSMGTFAAAAVAGDVARVQAVGSTITGWVNGVIRITVIDSSVTSGTSVGLRSMSTSGLRYDNFLAADVVTGATLGVASSIETAQALVGGKSGTLGTAAEVDTAQPLPGTKAASLGTASAVEAAQPLTGLVSATLGTASATETARPLTGTLPAALGPAAESDTAQALTGTKAGTLPVAASVETAEPLTGAKSGSLGPAVSVETAQPLAGITTATLGTAVEISTARPLTGSGPSPDTDITFTVVAAPERWTASEPDQSHWLARAGAQRWTAREPDA